MLKTERIRLHLADRIFTSNQVSRIAQVSLRQLQWWDVSKWTKAYDRRIERAARERYSEVELLQQANGVGVPIALTYVLTLEDPQRLRRSWEVGSQLGLRPRRRDSSNSQRQLRISQEGTRIYGCYWRLC